MCLTKKLLITTLKFLHSKPGPREGDIMYLSAGEYTVLIKCQTPLTNCQDQELVQQLIEELLITSTPTAASYNPPKNPQGLNYSISFHH